MINLRYHIVSIVGIFMALGIGVALGSTFVDGFIVSTLQNRVDDLESSRNGLRDELTVVRESLVDEQAERAAQDVAAIPLLGGGRLSDIPVMIIATEGIDPGAFQTVRAALLGTDAQYEGTLWLTERLDLSDGDNRTVVAETLGLVSDGETLVRTALEVRLARALFPPAPDTAGNVLGATATEVADELLDSAAVDLAVLAPVEPGALTGVLTQLRDAALVDYDNEFAATGALEDVPAHGTRFILLSSAEAELDPGEILVPLFDAVVEQDLDVFIVALEPAPVSEDIDGVAFVGTIRNEPRYRDRIATVDHANTFNGTLAALILTDSAEVAHLGSGEGATAELPAA